MVACFFLLLSLLSVDVPALSNRVANYTIDVKLDPQKKKLNGTQTLTWTNTSTKAVSELHFHTYLNAFKDSKSTFMKGSGGKLRTDLADTSKNINRGHITVSNVVLNNKHLVKKLEYIQPDDLNINDQTVLKMTLPIKIAPHETVQITMDFESKLPKVFARTGWASNDYFFVGQWFPKIGVLEKDGNWNCHQFHANTEFFSDFGTYKVNITLPSQFVVAATGQKISEVKLKSNLKNIRFEAEDVHDFAWTAYPYFKEFTETYKGIELKAFMQPEHQHLTQRYFESAKNAIDYMQKHIGQYPYKTLSMIDPSYDGSGSGGMEYPTLITCGAYWGLGKWLKYQEVVTIHEFIHQYFQGMLASNEFENSWMDEGFTQYMEGKVMDTYYPKGAVFNLLGFSMNDAAVSREDYVSLQNPKIVSIRTDVWKYPRGTYPTMSYTKPATVLKTLENLVGEKTMNTILKTYFERFRFKHPTPQDFFDTANEVAAQHTSYKSLDWFFKATILEAKTCDYTVQSLKNKNGKGSFQLRNLGDLKIPVDVLITFHNKSSKTIKWNGENKNFAFNSDISSVQIDPKRVNWLDLNLLNNSISTEPSYSFALKYASKFLFWIQMALA